MGARDPIPPGRSGWKLKLAAFVSTPNEVLSAGAAVEVDKTSTERRKSLMAIQLIAIILATLAVNFLPAYDSTAQSVLIIFGLRSRPVRG